MSRPYFHHSTAQLTSLFAANRRNQVVLRHLAHELEHRDKPKAAQLRREVAQALSEMQNRVVAPTPVERSLARQVVRQVVLRPSDSPAAAVVETHSELPHTPADPEALRVLDAWTALEVLSPQSYARPEDLVAGDTSRVAWLDRGLLPWQTASGGRPRKRLYYQLILGELQLAPAYEALLETFKDERPDRPTTKSHGVVAVLVCDGKGVPQGEVSISSFAWALPHALAGELDKLKDWRREEGRLKDALLRRLPRNDEAGGPAAFTRESLQEAHDWLVRTLRLPREFVKPPSFAIREYQYLFIHKPPDSLLLNSFFLGDLARARALVEAHAAPQTLRRYLGALLPPKRKDVLRDSMVFAELLAPARTPNARWPARDGATLVPLQQAAVNLTLSSSPGDLVAVNGPPGTGKTTLLRDVVAGVIAARAEVLASFDDPASAFRKNGVVFTQQSSRIELRDLDPRLRGFEMVVASSNNKAVENISAELPGLHAIRQEAPQIRYFSSVATALRDEPCWGLIAAVLGNAANRYRFQQTFWRDENRGLESYLATAAGTPRRVQVEDGPPQVPQVVALEDPPSGREEALVRWRKARQRFVDAQAAVRAMMHRLELVHRLEMQLSGLRARLEQGDAKRRDAEFEWIEARTELSLAVEAEQKPRATHDEMHAASAAHLARRPNIFARLFSTANARAWRDRDRALNAAILDVTAALEAVQARRIACEARVQETTSAIDQLHQTLTRDRESLAAAEKSLNEALATLGGPTGTQLCSLPHEEKHRSAAWFEQSEQYARDEVFASAMALHKAFIDAAAEPLRHNLTGFFRHLWTGIPGAKADQFRDLWASFALVVPLVSTTYASVDKMFGALGPGSIGWLLLDESGQATPQAAVGAILRAQRAIVVGDPMQVEPVMQLPPSLTSAVSRRFGVSANEFAAPEASAQVLADRASPVIATFEGRCGSRTVGIPLLVHRRCAEPMFGISNAVAYENLMVKATPERRSAIGDVLGASRWLDVEGSASRAHYSEEEGELLMEILRRLASARVEPDLYIVSPFRAVAQNLRVVIRSAQELRGWISNPGSFVNERVGTVHTVQGREAEAVVLVLGAPAPRQEWARRWAGATPNLVNVAVTRAKERLYVIGNRRLWRNAGYFRMLDQRLR